MTFTVLFLGKDLDIDTARSVSDPMVPDFKQAMEDGTYEDRKEAIRAEAAQKLLAARSYDEVAKVETTDLEFIFGALQNGPYTPSWSQLPLKGVTPLGLGYHEMDIPVARAAQMRAEASRYWSETSEAEQELYKRNEKAIVVVNDPVKGQCERWRFGYKSMSVGDLVRNDETGELFVVASFGFKALPALPKAA